MDTEKKVKILNTVLQSIVFGLVFTLLGQYVGMLEKAHYLSSIGVTYAPSFAELSFSAIKFWIPAIIGAIIGFMIVYFLPVINWGINLALKLNAKHGTLLFKTILCFVVAVFMVVILSVLMSILTTVILVDPSAGEYQATIGQAIIGGLKYLYLFFPVAWILAILIADPAEKMARGILKAPIPDYSHH
ncbi:hypothetical protein Q5O24_10555 [Eubacteriaceae bacterium ES3]|nr:hypothetical protein Q5O24_10555 [Eubacteriaceae bacterium ES3]